MPPPIGSTAEEDAPLLPACPCGIWKFSVLLFPFTLFVTVAAHVGGGHTELTVPIAMSDGNPSETVRLNVPVAAS